ncbi:Cj0069 family protein [Methylobacterium nigriterrae]|uniref:Cj0069 family protein n=1 Tax=Methylobacterium nigriterrae TaxID=3127512 RepID=UPI003013AA62
MKRDRGNAGIGVWKVERAAGGDVVVQEARDRQPRVMALDTFMAERAADFVDAGALIDQPFQARHLEGMIRCYMSGGRLVGFGHQLVRALAPPEAGPAPPRLYSGPDDARFQRLRSLLGREWTPQMTRLLDLEPDALPVIWDADFLLGPKAPDGEDTYVLCEINASSVFPIPDEAPDALAETMLQRLVAARDRSTAAIHQRKSKSTNSVAGANA